MGHIFFIAPNEASNLDEIANWTLYWLLEHDLVPDTAIYTCQNLRQATVALEAPLNIGESPALVVVDHEEPPREETIEFAKNLRNCIPESWVIEMVPLSMPLPEANGDQFWIRKPVRKEEWLAVLEHVFLRASTPQWSETER